MLPEPGGIIKGIPVSVYHIIHRIKLENYMQVFRHDIKVPHNGDHPYAHLKNNIYYLCKIPEKNHDGTGGVADTKRQYEHADKIINKLQGIKSRGHSVGRKYHKGYNNKEPVYKKCGNGLYHRQYAYFKYHLFNQIAVLHKGIGSAA